jgi:hypothetical protein
MIPQLVQHVVDAFGIPRDVAANTILAADPLDLVLRMEQVWNVYVPDPATTPNPSPAGPARVALINIGGFRTLPIPASPAWDHLGYSYVLENTRIVQILRRVVREYRVGEGLGIPSLPTQRWLNATEALLFGAANPFSSWLSTSFVRLDPEAVRRNAYWRFFGLDLAFGGDDNKPPVYDKANAANTSFVRLFEELLFELWQAMTNERNYAGANASDDDRIYRLAEELRFILESRRQSAALAREELAAATALGWAELTVSFDSPVVADLRAQAESPSDRLRLIGERVGLPAHSKSAAFFSMASELSLFLRTIEAGIVSGPQFAWVLYLPRKPATQPATAPEPIGAEARRVITEWAAATGKDLKARGKPVETARPRLVAAR